MNATAVQTFRGSFFLAFALLLIANPTRAQTNPTSIAVLDFGSAQTGARTAARIRELFRSTNVDGASSSPTFRIIDPDLARTAAAGAGFQGSLNLTVQEARDLGAAIGCDYYFIGDAQTFKRSPSTGADYYESYASIFLVSGRTGKLLFWERPLIKRDSGEQAESELLSRLSSRDTLSRLSQIIQTAGQTERTERIAAVETPAPIIEVMSDENGSPDQPVRVPRPYRRLKPPYPESAASAEAEAVVDVLVDIDAQGEIDHLEIARWAGYGLDQSVLDTVKQMHFFPALREGVAIPMRVLLRYNFRKPPPIKRPS